MLREACKKNFFYVCYVNYQKKYNEFKWVNGSILSNIKAKYVYKKLANNFDIANYNNNCLNVQVDNKSQ